MLKFLQFLERTEDEGRFADWNLLRINPRITGMKGQVGLIRLPPIEPFGLVNGRIGEVS